MGFAYNIGASLVSALVGVPGPFEAEPPESNGYGEVAIGWFDQIVAWAEPHYDRFLSFITEFYANYGALGMVVGLVLFALAIVAVVYVFRFIGFVLRMLKKLFLKITGIERKRKEKADLARMQKHARGASYNELLNWGKTSDSPTSENFWEEVVTKAAAEVAIARAPEREKDAEVWDKLLTGVVSYQAKLGDMERAVFAFEEKIHNLIGNITTFPKNELASETGRLRYGLETLKNDTDKLKKLQELFPDDVNISSLVELCEAFIISTKNIENGFLAALAS